MVSKHIGIVGCSAEGAALCYRTICLESAQSMGEHFHPEISMHTHSLGEYMINIRSADWQAVAEMMLSSTKKLQAAGADFVMLGGILSGHDESTTGQFYIKDGKRYVKFYGMSSQRANEMYSGGTQEYRAAEGKEIEVELKGPVENTLNDILGGVRSTCTYLNCKNIEDLPNNSEFLIGN